MTILLAIQLLGLLWMSAIFSGSETGLYSLSRVKLRYRLTQDERRARVMQGLLEPLGPSIITILIGNNIAAQLLASGVEQGLHGLPDPWGVIATILVLTPLVLVFGEFLPKYLFHRHADILMYRLAYGLRAIRTILAGPVLIVRGLTWIVERMLGGDRGEIWEPHTSRPNLRTFLNSSGDTHDLKPVQSQLVDRILAMERMTLAYAGVTKPLSDLDTLDAQATVAAARNSLGPKYFQRYLVHDHTSGQPVGYVTAVDLVISDGNCILADLMHELPRLAADTPLHAALQGMHAGGADLALVVRDDEVIGIAFRGDCVRVLASLNKPTIA